MIVTRYDNIVVAMPVTSVPHRRCPNRKIHGIKRGIGWLGSTHPTIRAVF
jgi:hypothetical protein